MPWPTNTGKTIASSSTIWPLRTERHPMHLPHRVSATILVTYLDPDGKESKPSEIRAVVLRDEFPFK